MENNRRGFGRGALLGQTNNLIGHALSLTLAGFDLPKFSDGAFVYGRKYLVDTGAITIGNVISGDAAFLSSKIENTDNKIIDHERAHIPQSQALGALYLVTQGLTLGITNFFPGGHHGKYNFLECNLQWISVPAGSSCQ